MARKKCARSWATRSANDVPKGYGIGCWKWMLSFCLPRVLHNLFRMSRVSLRGCFCSRLCRTCVDGRQARSWGRSRSHPTCSYVRRIDKKHRENGDLLGWVLDEADTRFDVSLEALDGFLQKLLLISVGAAKDVDGFLGSVGLCGMILARDIDRE